MPRDAAAYLWDAQRTASLAPGFTAGRRVAERNSAVMPRWALERQVQVGAHRNMLVHGYALVDHERSRAIATEELLTLRLQRLLREVAA